MIPNWQTTSQSKTATVKDDVHLDELPSYQVLKYCIQEMFHEEYKCFHPPPLCLIFSLLYVVFAHFFAASLL